MIHKALLAELLVLAVFSAGCASRPDVSQPRHSQVAGEIWGAQTVGQTFVAQQDGLNRIDVLLATYARENTGPVVFHLRDSPDAGHDLVTLEFDAAGVQDNTYRTFTFPPLPNSLDRSYYFFLEAPAAEPGNAITVWASPIDSYSQGQAYLAGQPQRGDLAFRTYAEYSITQIGRDLWRGLRHHAGTAILAILLFVVPGAAVLSLLGWGLEIGGWGLGTGDWRLETGDWGGIALAAGLSVAVTPLLILFASLAGLHLSRGPIIALLALFAVLVALVMLLRRLRSVLLLLTPSPPHPLTPSPPLPASVFLSVFVISLAARLLVAQELAAPMWGDSYHHTLIAQLLVDHGGLFQSWEPYAPLRSLAYHFGFHSNVAFFHWLTGISVLNSVIVIGQILNALAPLMIYPLVRRLGGSAWAGLVAVLIASLLSPMPARYIIWGRYTQLTGMVVLPVAATLTIDAVSNGDWLWRRLVLAGLATAGLILSHYLVVLLYLPLLLAYLMWWTGRHIQQRSSPLSDLTKPWLQTGAIGLVAGVLLLPWIFNLWRSLLPRVLASRFGAGAQGTYLQTAYNAAGDVLSYVPAWLIALAAVSAAWGWWRRRPLAVVASIWTVLLILVANPNMIGLPGAGVVNNFALLIALYLPLSILAGAGLARLIEYVIERAPRGQPVVVALIIVAALAGARLRLMDLDYRYRLVTPADREAMQWIRDHTPADARFLVNAHLAFGGHTVVGDDAGWWIPYLAGRRNTVPPATYGLELPRDPDYPIQVEAFYRAVTAQPLNSSEAVQVLRANDVTHIYIGAAGGELLDPAILLESSLYRLVYNRDGVMIFEVG